jgi:hypothetical protein
MKGTELMKWMDGWQTHSTVQTQAMTIEPRVSSNEGTRKVQNMK